jgi:hypothetical protein
MKTVITILFWAALLTAFSIHGAKADKAVNTSTKPMVTANAAIEKP